MAVPCVTSVHAALTASTLCMLQCICSVDSTALYTDMDNLWEMNRVNILDLNLLGMQFSPFLTEWGRGTKMCKTFAQHCTWTATSTKNWHETQSCFYSLATVILSESYYILPRNKPGSLIRCQILFTGEREQGIHISSDSPFLMPIRLFWLRQMGVSQRLAQIHKI